MTGKRFIISFENSGCSRCLFLNSSDTGENCKILRSDIQEGEWSNIDYQFEKNWRYKGCPLIHRENLNDRKGILNINEFVELKGDVE